MKTFNGINKEIPLVSLYISTGMINNFSMSERWI